MIIAQVCLRLATIKGHSKMCSFITQHNATDASFEGACNWHADCRNVHQSCCRELNVHFSTISRLQKAYQRIWQYIQPASQPQTTCNHTSPGPPHPAYSPPRLSSQVKSSHLYLYSAFNNTDCVKALNSIKLEDRVSVMYNNKIKHSIFS